MSQYDSTLEKLREKAAAEKPGEEEATAEATETVEGDEPVAEESRSGSSLREYVIISNWKEVARIEASSAEGALRSLGKDDGMYVVVPARNFSAFDVKTETQRVTHVTPK